MTLSAVIEVGLDGSKVAEGVAPITRTLENFGKTAQRVGQDAGAAMGKVGEGADKSSAKIEAATRNMISSLERRIAATAAAGKGEREYQEIIARQRGINLDRINPYLNHLDELKSKQVAVGMSTAAMNNAMRNVPAQFTDIVVSLQGGQKPMTVLLQQGGQLKDMFGGIGPAAKALGGYITGMINPLTLAAAGIAALGASYYYGSEQSKRLNASLILTGNMAGTTGEKLNSIAESVGKATGKYSEARDAVASLAEAGTFSASAIGRLSGAIVAGSNLTGKSIQEMVADFEKINKDPLKAIDELNSKYNFLTTGIRSTIKALEEQGRTTQAAALASDSYADAMKSRNSQVIENLGSIERGWKGISEATKFALNLAQSVGRQTDPAQDLLIAQDKLKVLNQSKAGIRGTALFSGGLNEDIAAQEKLISSLTLGISVKDAAAAATGRIAAEEKKFADQSRNLAAYVNNDKHLTKSKALEEESKAFSKATEGYAKNSKEYQLAVDANAQAVKKINDQFKDKPEHISKEISAYGALTLSIREHSSALDADLQKLGAANGTDKLRVKYLEELTAGKIAATSAERLYIRELLAASSAKETLIEQDKKSIAQSKAFIDSINAQYLATVKVNDSADEYARTVAGSIRQSQLEMSLMGASADYRETKIAQLKIEIELEKKIQDIKKQGLLLVDENNAIASVSSTASIEMEAAAQKVKLTNWTKSVEQYDDIFRKGFAGMVNGGKDAWSSFTTSLVTTFKTSVADQIYKMFAQPFVVKMVGSMMGVFGSDSGVGSAAAASGAAGGSGSMFGSSASALSTGKTLWDGFSAASSIGGGIGSVVGSGIGGVGGMIGSSTLSAFGSGMAGTATGTFAGAGMTIAGAETGMGALAAGSGATVAGAGASLTAGLAAIPVWGWVALAAIAAVKFGSGKDRVSAGSSVSGSLGTDNLTRNQSWTKDGGWFNSDTSGTWNYGLSNSTAIVDGRSYTDTANLDSDKGLLKNLNSAYETLKKNTASYALSLGISADSIKSRSDAISFSIGRDAKETQSNIAKAFSDVGDKIASDLLGPFSDLKKEGEGSAAAMVRLSGDLTATNLAMKALGLATYAVSIDGAKGAESLITLFGSLQDLQTASSSYYDNFYSDAEKLKLNTSLVADAFAAAGKTMPSTREALRAMVETAKSAGDESSYASLIKLSSAFASVVAATDTTTAALQAKAKAEANANERAGLSKELMQQMNDVVGLRKLELDAIDASNRGLKQQIYDLQDKQKAEELAAASAQKLVDSWQSITDSLVSEITRIKGLIGGDSAQSYAGAQSQFAVTTAQARAGDQNAAKLLPQLSQTMLAMAEQNAASAFDLLRIREMTAASLAATATDYKKYGITLPSFDIGTDYVPEDQIAKIHRGERITPAAYNRSDVTNADLVAEIKMLNEKVAQLIAINVRTEEHTRGSADSLDRVTNGGAVLLVEMEKP